MKRYINFLCFGLAIMLGGISTEALACTGIALRAADGSRVVARTVEWSKGAMHCGYVVVPRDYKQYSFLPGSSDVESSALETGLAFKAHYGYVGIYTEYENFVVEGVNEVGLSAGLFFFPGFGEYPTYSKALKNKTICDMQLVSLVLSTCATVDHVKSLVSKIQLCSLGTNVGTVHWRFTEPSGRMVVLEYKNGTAQFYENSLGVLTNSPGFDFHLTNLRNYLNLSPGDAPENYLGQVPPAANCEASRSAVSYQAIPSSCHFERNTSPCHFERSPQGEVEKSAHRRGHNDNAFQAQPPVISSDGAPCHFERSPQGGVEKSAHQASKASCKKHDGETRQAGLLLTPLGGNSGMLGLPGDYTPPSRFVRAAFFSATAPVLPSGFETVTQAFHILNNFDIPVGVQHKQGTVPVGLPSATQFTTATDLNALKFYYRTAWNQNIRCIELQNIDFSRIKFRATPLDNSTTQPVEVINIQ